MRREAKKYLYDIQKASMLLAEFTAGRQFADYAREAMLRAALARSVRCWAPRRSKGAGT